MAKYMKGQFDFFGVKSPLCKEILASLVKKHRPSDKQKLLLLVNALWNEPERELQFFACNLLIHNIRILSPEDLPFLLSLAIRKSWWDTIDTLATRIIGPILLSDPTHHKRISKQWIHDPIFWIQRIALLYQLKWKSETTPEHIFALIRHVADEKEFFIRKAIGWILREYSKTNANAVQRFIKETELSPLSRREALKWLNNH